MVAVHDSARPLVTAADAARAMADGYEVWRRLQLQRLALLCRSSARWTLLPHACRALGQQLRATPLSIAVAPQCRALLNSRALASSRHPTRTRCAHTHLIAHTPPQVGAAVLGVPVKPTIKEVDGDMMVEQTLQRAKLWEVQTPQCIRPELLREGFRLVKEKGLEVTDDVSIIEALGLPVRVTPGAYTNIKVTTPDDMAVAEKFIDEAAEQAAAAAPAAAAAAAPA